MHRFFFCSVIIVGLFATGLFGCAHGGPSAPEITGPSSPASIPDATHQLWGLYDIALDPETGIIEAVPLRTADFNANVTMFLQPPSSPIHLLTISLEMGSDIANGYWVIDVTLRHPFLSYSLFRGFDVRGIIIAEGGTTGIHDPGVNYRTLDGTRVINADGYSRWWNMQEFTTYGTILGYTEGARSIPGFVADATLNPYKLFTDALDEEAPVYSMDPDFRATFATNPGINTRRYKIQFDLDGGTPPIRFKYAIDASWSLPDPAYEPEYPVEAYDLSANCQEPYLLNVPLFEQMPYYENASVNGGDAVFFLTIGDWQAESGDTVLDQLSHIWVESPTLLDAPLDVLPTAEFVNSNHPTQATCRITVPGCHPTGLEGQEFLITAESADPDSYMPQIQGDPYAFDWPDVPLAAYVAVGVPVNPEGPVEPEEYFVVGLPDWCALTEHCTDGVDNLQIITNLIEWDLEGPYNDNMTIKWWGGHVIPQAPYSTSVIQSHVINLGYTFVRTQEPVFDPTDCRMIIVNFVRSGNATYTPFTPEEIHDMKAFVKDGGVLCFLIEGPGYFSPVEFEPLMDGLGAPLTYGGQAEPPSTTTQTTNITAHFLTTDVYTFQYWTCGEFTFESDECISLVRSPTGEHLVVLAPVDVD